MNSALVFLCVVAVSYAQVLGQAPAEDDGSWKPHLDGSQLGNGDLRWFGADQDDGQWKPQLYNPPSAALRRRRSLINANALPVPADTLEVSLAKQAQLIQQNTEGTRNILGGGIPLHLPADTLEVAIGKQAHAIAHENQKAATAGIPLAAAVHAPLAYSAIHAPIAHSAIHAPLAYSGIHAPLAYSGIHAPLGYGVRALW